MGTFYSTANIFAHQPLRAFAVAGFFLLLAVAVRRMKRRAPDLSSAPFVAGAVLWGLFGLNEFFWYAQLSTVPIRVDLFITWPVLVALTALCLIGGLIKSTPSIRIHSTRTRRSESTKHQTVLNE